MKNDVKANLMAVCSILLWCFSGACFRNGAILLGPMTYLALITGGGALTACLLQISRKQKISRLFILPRKVIIFGFFGVTLYTVILAFAFSMAKPEDIGLINLINYLWPVWMVIFQIVILKTRTNKLLLCIGIMIGFLGLGISQHFDFFYSPRGSLLPHFLALSGGLLWALYSVMLKKLQIPVEQGGTAFHFGLCALISGIIAFFFEQSELTVAKWPVETLFWVLFGAVGPVGIAYYLWEAGVKKGSVGFIAALSYFIPIGSSIILGLMFSETMRIGLLPGALMIAAGAWIVRQATLEKPGNTNL